MKKVLLAICLCTVMLFVSCGENGGEVTPAPTQVATIETVEFMTYVNDAFGFSLDFPVSWTGFYKVNDVDKSIISFNFVGKSEYSRKVEDGDGIPLFYITSKKGEGEKIGKVGKKTFYFIRGDETLFEDFKDQVETYMNMDGEAEETKFLQEDYANIERMLKDIDSIIETFKEV